jgi:hypothetical protein
VTVTCGVTLGALALHRLQVHPVLPTVAPAVPPSVYMAGTVGYLNPYRSFEVTPVNILVGSASRCEQRQDHDRDDCKQPHKTVPEPASLGLMFGGLLGIIIILWKRQ